LPAFVPEQDAQSDGSLPAVSLSFSTLHARLKAQAKSGLRKQTLLPLASSGYGNDTSLESYLPQQSSRLRSPYLKLCFSRYKETAPKK